MDEPCSGEALVVESGAMSVRMVPPKRSANEGKIVAPLPRDINLTGNTPAIPIKGGRALISVIDTGHQTV